jgi:hypothetical protein
MPFDLTSKKVLVPALLFALLSPGLILSLPSMKLFSGTTSCASVFIHALVLILALWVASKSKMMGTTTQADLLVPAFLFILLSPGMLVTIPPGSIMSGLTSKAAVGVHTVVFAILFALLRSQFPQYY